MNTRTMAGRWTNATLCVLLALLASEASALPLPLPLSLLHHLRLQLSPSEAPIYPDAAARFPHQIFTAISDAIDDFPRSKGDEKDYLLRDDARERIPGPDSPAYPGPSYTPPERHWDARRPWDTATRIKTAVAQDSRSRATSLLQVVQVPQRILALVRGFSAPTAWQAGEEERRSSSDESTARRGSREAERIQLSRLGELRRRHQPSYIAAKERLHRQLDPERRKADGIPDTRPLRS